MFEDMLELLTRARDRGDVEILTMGEVLPGWNGGER